MAPGRRAVVVGVIIQYLRSREDAGLLTPQALENLLWDAVRRKATDELFETADRLAEANIPPMTMEEIQAEVDADIYLPALLLGFPGSKRWIAAEHGRIGGSV